MVGREARYGQKRRPVIADEARLNELALAYVARFATTRAKLLTYLQRKIREADAADLSLAAEVIADRMVELGFINDLAYAESKAASLERRGYGARRVKIALVAAGIASETASELTENGDALATARAFAQRRRLGPFTRAPEDRKALDRAIAAMMRAGHDFQTAKRVLVAE